MARAIPPLAVPFPFPHHWIEKGTLEDYRLNLLASDITPRVQASFTGTVTSTGVAALDQLIRIIGQMPPATADWHCYGAHAVRVEAPLHACLRQFAYRIAKKDGRVSPVLERWIAGSAGSRLPEGARP